MNMLMCRAEYAKALNIYIVIYIIYRALYKSSILQMTDSLPVMYVWLPAYPVTTPRKSLTVCHSWSFD